MVVGVVRGAFVLLVASVLAGCAAGYRPPPGAALGADYAELTFELALTDMVGFGSATTQRFAIGTSPDETQGQGIRMFTWAHKDPKVILVPSGQPLHVFATMTGLWGAPGVTHSGSDSCRNVSLFTPRANTRYRVSQVGEPTEGCRLRVIDAATGTEPDDVSRIRFAPAA